MKKKKDFEMNSKPSREKNKSTELVPAKSTKGPPANPAELTDARSQHANDRLKALVHKADALLADQRRMLENVSQLLDMEEAVGVYIKAFRASKKGKAQNGAKKAPR